MGLSIELPDCDFEIDTCGWNVEAELNGTEFFIFIRTFGELHEGGDGPKTDHTESKSGTCITYFIKTIQEIMFSLFFVGKRKARQSRNSDIII